MPPDSYFHLLTKLEDIATPIVTIYLCGTGKTQTSDTSGNREKEYLIGDLYRHTMDRAPAADTSGRKQIFDGPGTNIRAVQDVVEGEGRTNWRGREYTPSNMGYRSKLSGNMSGVGWADNAHLAMQWLLLVNAELGQHGLAIRTVNMVGHSRGAVTATMLAHMLYREQPDWRVNIFAIDPVPGSSGVGFRTMPGIPGDPAVLPPNVRDYTSILMEHVPSTGKDVCFQPIHPGILVCQGDTSVTTIPMPGKHGDAVKTNFTGSYPISGVSSHLITTWLIEHGTNIDDHFTKTPTELLELYAQSHPAMRGKQKAAKSASSSWRMNPFRWGLGTEWVNDRARVVENACRDHPYYLNLHHAILFQQAFPGATQNLDTRKWLLKREIRQQAAAYPHSVELLHKLRLVADDDLAERLQKVVDAYTRRTTGARGFFSRQSNQSSLAIDFLRQRLHAYEQGDADIERPVLFFLAGTCRESVDARCQQLNRGSRLWTMLNESYSGWRADWQMRLGGH